MGQTTNEQNSQSDGKGDLTSLFITMQPYVPPSMGPSVRVYTLFLQKSYIKYPKTHYLLITFTMTKASSNKSQHPSIFIKTKPTID